MALLQEIDKAKSNPDFVSTRPVKPGPLGDNLLARIGNTPLLPLHRIAAVEGVAPNVVVFAKAEWFDWAS